MDFDSIDNLNLGEVIEQYETIIIKGAEKISYCACSGVTMPSGCNYFKGGVCEGYDSESGNSQSNCSRWCNSHGWSYWNYVPNTAPNVYRGICMDAVYKYCSVTGRRCTTDGRSCR